MFPRIPSRNAPWLDAGPEQINFFNRINSNNWYDYRQAERRNSGLLFSQAVLASGLFGREMKSPKVQPDNEDV